MLTSSDRELGGSFWRGAPTKRSLRRWSRRPLRSCRLGTEAFRRRTMPTPEGHLEEAFACGANTWTMFQAELRCGLSVELATSIQTTDCLLRCCLAAGSISATSLRTVGRT